MQYAGAARIQACGVISESRRSSAGFNGDQLHRRLVHEWIHDSYGVRSAADARHYHIRQSSDETEHLASSLAANPRSESPN